MSLLRISHRVVARAARAVLALAAALAWTGLAAAQTTYTWNRTTSAPWTTASNWTPSRSSPSSSDILVINGSTTPTATITSVPTQTIGRLRVINNANATLSSSGAVTLTLSGATAPQLDLQAGSTVTLGGTQAISLSLGSSASATVAGTLVLSGAAHTLLSPTASAIQFPSTGRLTTTTGFTGSAFGATGTANIAVFQSGSIYTHGAGSSVFGLTAPSSKVTFQTGSTVIYRTTTGYSSQGRVYSDLTLQNNVAISGSGTSNFTFRTLTVESGSSFTHNGSGSAVITIQGSVSSAGSGSISITPGSGGIQFNGGTVQVIGGGGGTGTITLGGNATVSSTTTVAVARTLSFSAGTMTVNGTFRIDQGGFASGSTNFVYGSSSTLAFNNSSGSFGVNSNHVYWPSANAPPNVHVLGAGGITLNSGATRTVSGLFQTAATVTNANLLTLSGTVRRNAGGSFSASPVYSGTATLVYAAGHTVGPEWSSGGAVGAGVPRNVTVDAGSGTVSMPSSDRTVPGDLLVTSGTLALNASSGNLFVGGNWTNQGTVTLNGRLVTFNGSGSNQTITRTGGETFTNLAVDKPSGNLLLGSNVTVSGTSGDLLRILNSGAIDLNGNTLTLAGSGGNLLVGGTAATARSITGTGVLAFTGGKTVTNNNTRTLTLGAGVRTTLAAAVNFGASLTSVAGILELGSGGSVATNPPSYSSAAILRYATGGAVGRGPEWSATSGFGYPFHVEVTGATTFDLGNGGTGTPRQMAGNLTIGAGATFTTNNGANAMTAPLTVLGNVTVDGSLILSSAAGGDLALAGNLAANGTVTPNGRSVTFQGTGTQTVTRSSPLTLSAVRLVKGGGSVLLLADLDLTTTGLAVAFDGTVDVLDLNGRTLTLAGTVGGTDAAGAFRGSAASNLVLNGSGALGTLRFATGGQTLGQLTVQRTASGTVTLGSALTVSGTLTLGEGRVVTGANTLTLAPGAVVLRTSGWVDGRMAKRAATGSPFVLFEIGGASGYTPVSLHFGSVTTAGDFTAFTTNGDHPSVATSGIVPGRSVNRTYTVSNAGAVFDSYTATFTFLPGDVDAGANPSDFEVRRFAASTWSGATQGTTTATSVQASGITGVGDFAIGELVTYTITASAGANGTIAPAGAVIVRHGKSRTFLMSGDLGYHVADVVVNGGSVGATSSYTFTNVVANHTISATFDIDHYTLSITPAGEGSFTATPEQPTYTYGSFVELRATPALGWDFAGWDAGDFFTTENPLALLMDRDKSIVANFVRAPVKYERTIFTAPYTPLSIASGASVILSAADDSTRSIPLPFPFHYSGLNFTTSNYLAINANGFVFPTRVPVTSSLSAQANNFNLFASTAPNATIAPWYDDLAVNAVSTNPEGRVLYQTQGTPGSRRLTVQWTDVSSYSSAASGLPRRLNFQVVLHEGTHVIEFRYAPTLGTSWNTLESASIGLEDSLGGNNLYLDAITGSRVAYHGMVNTNKFPARNFRFTPVAPAPLAPGVYTAGNGGHYPSLSEAAADLNHRGVSGPVTIRLTDAVSDTTGAGGNNTFPILLTRVPGASATNTITIEPAGASHVLRARGTESGSCGNQSISNVVSTSNEPVLALLGSDHVTLRNLTFEGGPLLDRGVLLVPSSPSDGAQNNTLRDLTVRLTRTNTQTVGIQQQVPTTPTGIAGTNSFNRYYNLSVSSSYSGVSLAGNVNVPDEGVELGVIDGGSTVIGGPTAGDLGGGTSSAFGIRANNQKNVRITGAEVRNVGGTGAGTVDGILLDNLGSATFDGGVAEISRNRIHHLDNTSVSAGRVTGIRVNLSANAGSSSRVFNNFVYALNSASTSTASRRIVGILLQDAGGGGGARHHVDFNSVRIAPTNLTSPNTCFEVGTATGPAMLLRNNVFANFVGTQSGSGKHYCVVTPGVTLGPAGSFADKNVLHINNLANGYTGSSSSFDRATLADWQAATGHDLNSASTNPQFVSDVDLHINVNRPTPVESHGSTFSGTLSWVPADIDGDLRDPATPDAGADEGTFNLLVGNDIGAAAFVDPAEGSMKIAGSSFTPQATFENAGSNAQTNVPVRFRILGPLPLATVVYDRSTTIGSLPVGVSQNVSFPPVSLPTGGFYTIQAISSLFNDQNHGNDQISGTFENAGPLAGTYVVGASQSPPFRTLTGAVGRLNTVGVSGPVTFVLSDAAYGPSETFPITVTSYPGAGASSRVTIRPASGVNAAITGTNARAILQLSGADYVTVDGSNTVGGTTRNLTLTNLDPSAGSAVVWLQNSGGNPVTHCTIQNAAVVGSGNTQTMIGIGIGGTTLSLTSGGAGNDNNTIANCQVRRTQVGIYAAGQSAAAKSNGTTITRNAVDAAAPDHVSRYGILVRFENSVQITQNRVAHIATAEAVSPVGIALGMTAIGSDAFVGDEVTNATVGRNVVDRVVSTSGDGLSAAGITVAPAGSGITTIVNNMVSRVTSPALDPDLTVGILVGGGGATTRLYFNSVAMTGDRGAASAPSLALGVGGTNPILDLRDNILVNTQTASGPGDSYALGLNWEADYSNLTSDYNDLWSSYKVAVVGGFLNVFTGEQTTLAQWRTTTGKDASSLSADPGFVSVSDLHIRQSGSPVANAGTPIAGVTTDLDGDTGNRASTPDLGADEFATHTLTVNVTGTGAVTRNPDLPNYVTGDPVELTAVPGTGWSFAAWSGDASGSANPLTLVMNADKTVGATFTLNSYPLQAAAVGGGSVARSPDQPSYPHGSTVTVTATPDVGHHFVGWSGDASGTANPLAVLMEGPRSVTATFAINTYTLDLTQSGTGTVQRDPDQPTYTHGTPVTLTASAGSGFQFTGWSGDTAAATNPLVLPMIANRSVHATFAVNTYTLDVTVVGNGSVAKDPDQPTYLEGAEVQLTATPDPGHRFVAWSGGATGSANPVTVTMNGSQAVTATFELDVHVVDVTEVGHGSVSRQPDQPTYLHGSSVELTAVPEPGHAFVGWSGDVSGTQNPISLVVDGPKTVTATFTWSLATTVLGNGSLARSPDQAVYAPGTVVQLTPTPDPGHAFVDWAGDASGSANPLQVTIDGDRSITARFTVALATAVVGGGSVSRSPDQTGYPLGSVVQLTAEPAAGYHFSHWSGDATGSANPVAVTLDGNRSVTAHFALNTYPLTVATTGSGAVSRAPDQPAYDHGSTVELTATPDPGHSFVSWSGDASGAANPLVVTMDAAKSVTAVFTNRLDVTVVGNGSVGRSPDQVAYAPGATVTLTATPAAHHHLTAWSGDASGTANPVEVVMNGNRAVTATFAIDTHVLAVSTVGNGAVARSPDQPAYDHGSVVQLTPTAATGWTFTGWSGDASGNDVPLLVTMDAAKSITATFTINTYTLDLSTSGSGSVARSPDQASYEHGTSVTLTATPDVGWNLVGWSGSVTGSDNPLVVVMNGHQSITATFAQNTYALTVNVAGSGAVARSPDQASYVHGSVVSLTPQPQVGHHFVGWSGDATGSDSPLSVTMDGPKTITATFAINTYPLTVSTVGNGAVARSPDQPAYDHGTVVTLTATPAAGHHFVGWSGDATGSANPLAITMDAARSVTATFAINTYPLTLTAAGNGALAKSPDQPAYDHGTSVTVTATPATGHHFVGWSGDASGAANPLVLTMDAAKAVTGTFAVNTYPLDVVASGSGSVARSPDQPAYDHGTVVQLTATPATGWHFVGWSGDAAGSANPVTVAMEGPRSVTATFAINTYTLDVTVSGGGAVTPSPDQPLYDHGTAVTLTATPAPGSHFVGWSGDVTGAANPVVVTMDSDKDVTATFAINTYPLGVTVVGEGSVSRDPDQPEYDHGFKVLLTPTPQPGHQFVGWSGDASGTAIPLSVVMDEPKSITATFSIITYTLDVTAVGNGNVARSPDQAAYNTGTSVTLTATPAVGWHFLGWSGDASGATNPLVVTMDADKAIVATFEVNTYPVDIVVHGNGSVARVPLRAVYDHGSTVRLSAVAASGWHFTHWAGDVTGTADPVTVFIDGPKSLSCHFQPNQYTLNVTGLGGTVVKSPDQPGYASGAVVQLTAVPDSGHHFRDWIGDASGSVNPTTVTMNGDRSVTARFLPNTVTLDVAPEGGSGRLERFPDQPRYEPGTKVDIQYIPDPGYHFVIWTWNAGRDTVTANPMSVTLDTSITITATLVPGGPPALSTPVVGSGTVERSPDQPSYTAGTWVTLAAMPSPGWRFVRWEGDRFAFGNPATILMDRDKQITAVFASTDYTLDVATLGLGSVARAPDQPSYPESTVVQLTATPGPGYHFQEWRGDATGTANPLALTMTSSKSVIASFGFVVGVAVNGNGTVLKSPDRAVYAPGDTVRLVAQPTPHHAFSGWSGDTTSTASSLLVTMDRNRSVTATFSPILYTLQVTVEGEGLVVRAPDQPTYLEGTTVELTAMPAPGHRFVAWSEGSGERLVPRGPGNTGGCPDCVHGSSNPIQLTMSGNRHVIALFEPEGGLLTTATEGRGAVIRRPGDPAADGGATVELRAIPEAGWRFDGWSGDLVSSSDRILVPAGSAGRYVARFVEIGTASTAAAEPVRELAIERITPNPAAGRVRLEFAVPREGRVRLAVVDAQGREVARLADDRFRPGRHVATWDSRSGRGASPGIYFVRLSLEGAGRTLVRRLVVTR